MTLRATLELRRNGFQLDASIECPRGETVALLGPNGSGKSTVVALLAGLEEAEHGEVALDGRDLAGTLPESRPIGVMFQDLRLFPHLSALENVAFPLRARGVARREAQSRARTQLSDLGLPTDRHDTRPGELSGGQAQRVALARALVHRPDLLLLDEPTSALDVRSKAALRPVIGRALASFDRVRILVTHDPVEAMTLADRLIVIEDGRVTQTGSAAELRDAPRTPYVAELVGVNLYRGRLEPIEAGAGRLVVDGGFLEVAWPAGTPVAPIDDVLAILRPADVALHTSHPEGSSARNVLAGTIEAVSLEGERARVRVASTPHVVAEVTLGSVRRLGLREGAHVWASCKAVEIEVRVPGDEGQQPPTGTLGR